MPPKNSLRDKLEDDTLDLSLMQLHEAPVEEIAQLPKGTTLDLSNNFLTYLPDTFPTLTHLVKLDLSKNRIEELPEYFGQLRNLRHLDLYSNLLEKLPVSFASLKNLKWLDLKNNPLVPAVQQAAGPCITASDCAMCAKKVVALMQSMQSQLERERQRRLLEDRRVIEEQQKAEEQERERLRAEKRAAKERRRDEARSRDDNQRRNSSGATPSVSTSGDNGTHSDMEKPRDGKNAKNGMQNGKGNQRNKSSSSHGWCWSLLMLFAGFSIVLFSSAVSILWIYTGGQLDQRSIERALPIIQRDVDTTLLSVGVKSEAFLKEANKQVGPYISSAAVKAEALWAELKRRNDLVAYYINENVGPYACQMKKTFIGYWNHVRPHFQHLGETIIRYWKETYAFFEKRVPIVWAYIKKQMAGALDWMEKTVHGLMA